MDSNKKVFFIDPTKKDLIIETETVGTLEKWMEKEGTPLKINSLSALKIFFKDSLLFFSSEELALKEVEKRKSAMKKMKAKKLTKSICMPMKRHYLIDVINGSKKSTVRTYNKGWKKGQLVSFTDRKNYVYAEITTVKKIQDGNYQYNFKLA